MANIGYIYKISICFYILYQFIRLRFFYLILEYLGCKKYQHPKSRNIDLTQS